MWKVSFVEKLKQLLLEKEWQTVSIYRMDNKILVYVNGELTLEIPVQQEPQEGEMNE